MDIVVVAMLFYFFPSPWHLLSVFIFFFCCLGGCCSSPFAVAIVVFSMHHPHQESWSSHILLLSLEMVVLVFVCIILVKRLGVRRFAIMLRCSISSLHNGRD